MHYGKENCIVKRPKDESVSVWEVYLQPTLLHHLGYLSSDFIMKTTMPQAFFLSAAAQSLPWIFFHSFILCNKVLFTVIVVIYFFVTNILLLLL